MHRIVLAATLILAGCARNAETSHRTTSPQPHLIQVDQPVQQINPARVRSGDPDWQRAEKEVCPNQTTLDARLAKLSRAQVENHVLRSGAPTRKEITLTFDDGPHPKTTLQLLDILKAENVPATFFVVGFMAEKYPELVKAIAAAGHEVADHTYSHVTLTKIPADQVLAEYQADSDLIYRLIGKRPRFCRPPGGDFNQEVLKCAADLGLTTVLWTDDPGDYAEPGDQVLLQREAERLGPGAIILLHDGSQDTVDTLATFIRIAKKKGFKFVPLDQLRRR
jgi:peptidoglycan/xylan/chitin deacetylase (PgdA/CDA1 family)